MDFDIYDWLQNARIRQVANTVEGTDRRLTTAAQQIESLQDQVDRLTLVCTALLELLRDRLQISDQALAESIRKVDLRDGKADGKLSITAANCAKCGRPNRRTRDRCLYCGKPMAGAAL